MGPPEGAEPLVVEVELRPEDLRRATWHLSASIALAPLLALLLCGAITGLVKLASAVGPVVAVLAAAAVATLVVWLWFWNGRRAHARLPEKRLVYRFEAEHLVCEGGPSSGRMAWSHLAGWTEDRHAFYVRPHPQIAYVIPKRSVPSPERVRQRLLAVQPPKRQVGRIAIIVSLLWVGLCLAFILLYNSIAAAP